MTIALLSPAASDVLRLVRRGVAWWLGELSQMLPRRLSGLLAGTADPLVLMTIGPGGPALWPADGLRQGAANRREHITIGLDRSLIFEASLELPRAAQQALPQIVQHQIERLVPMTARDTVFDYRLSPTNDDKLLKVRVYVAKRATIEEGLAAARAIGLVPRRVVLAGWPEPGGAPLLWQADNTADANRVLCRRLEFAALVLVSLAYGLYLHQLDRIRDELATRVAAVQPAAAAVEALARNLASVDADTAFFVNRRAEAPPLAVIDALTRLVPADSWLSGLVLDRRRVEISGYSPHASDLVALVERSTLFEQPRFSSPITLAPDGKREHFDLAFETKQVPDR